MLKETNFVETETSDYFSSKIEKLTEKYQTSEDVLKLIRLIMPRII